MICVVYQYEEGWRYEVRHNTSLTATSQYYSSFDDCLYALKERFPAAVVDMVVAK